MPVGRVEEARRQKLWNELGSDAELQKAFGLSKEAYKDWVKTRGYQLKGKNGSSPTPSATATRKMQGSEDEARLKSYHETQNDQEAAARHGVTGGAFRLWRKKRGLPAKADPHSHPRPKAKGERSRSVRGGAATHNGKGSLTDQIRLMLEEHEALKVRNNELEAHNMVLEAAVEGVRNSIKHLRG